MSCHSAVSAHSPFFSFSSHMPGTSHLIGEADDIGNIGERFSVAILSYDNQRRRLLDTELADEFRIFLGVNYSVINILLRKNLFRHRTA